MSQIDETIVARGASAGFAKGVVAARRAIGFAIAAAGVTIVVAVTVAWTAFLVEGALWLVRSV